MSVTFWSQIGCQASFFCYPALPLRLTFDTCSLGGRGYIPRVWSSLTAPRTKVSGTWVKDLDMRQPPYNENHACSHVCALSKWTYSSMGV